MSDINVIVLEGKILTSVVKRESDDHITFTTMEGKEYVMYHSQDCCECVRIYDIKGELSDLTTPEIKSVKEDILREKDQWPKDVKEEYDPESFTWTIFKFKMKNDKRVVIRWLGTSNGYYNEDVSFAEIK